MSEFCPQCFHPLEDSDDEGRLCNACRWFGDKTEVCETPPPPTSVELAFIQLLSLYRDICRLEVLAEQIAKELPDEHGAKLKAIKVRVAHAQHSLIYVFRKTQEKPGESGKESGEPK